MSDDNQQRVHFKNIDWRQLVNQRLGEEKNKPEPGYEFGARKFDTPTNGGPYRHE